MGHSSSTTPGEIKLRMAQSFRKEQRTDTSHVTMNISRILQKIEYPDKHEHYRY